MSTQNDRPIKVVTQNRKARYEYHIVDSIEAGIALVGTEVKALREGRCNMQDSYASFKDKKSNELWLLGMHISPYTLGNQFNHTPTRPRKLLLKKRELERLHQRVLEKGITLVPLRLYFSGPYAKIELGLARGKKMYDKRQDIKKKDEERQLRQVQD